MTFEEAFHSYMIVSGTERSAAYQDKLMFQFFVGRFGPNKSVSEIPRGHRSRSGASREPRREEAI